MVYVLTYPQYPTIQHRSGHFAYLLKLARLPRNLAWAITRESDKVIMAQSKGYKL